MSMTLYDLNAEQPPSCRERYRRGQRCDQCESPLLNPIEVRESSRKFEKVRESSRRERVLDDTIAAARMSYKNQNSTYMQTCTDTYILWILVLLLRLESDR